MRVMKLNEVINTTGLSRSSIYAYMTKGEFPKPIQLGPRAVAWIEEEVQGWLMERASQSRL
ncbi:DNA-binding protein [Marinomonas pontica]|uniref:DNA-binding protein n=1 Tax=Marinomonas pontica TaxID=264739 RepID=A0ABM8FCK6_9GAMM|nr:DNA-binding protein [Marinomonas pontica]